MPELGLYGSVRGAVSNDRPYRDSKVSIVSPLISPLCARLATPALSVVAHAHVRPLAARRPLALLRPPTPRPPAHAARTLTDTSINIG